MWNPFSAFWRWITARDVKDMFVKFDSALDAYRTKLAIEKAEAAVVKAAREWCREPEIMDSYEELKGTQSASAPATFMLLYEAVEELERLEK